MYFLKCIGVGRLNLKHIHTSISKILLKHILLCSHLSHDEGNHSEESFAQTYSKYTQLA